MNLACAEELLKETFIWNLLFNFYEDAIEKIIVLSNVALLKSIEKIFSQLWLLGKTLVCVCKIHLIKNECFLIWSFFLLYLDC